MSNSFSDIPKSTVVLAGALWAILALLGSVILANTLVIRQDQATMLANQSNNTRRIDRLEVRGDAIDAKNSQQDERIGRLEATVSK